MKMIREWGEAIIVAVILTVIIRFFVVQAFKIPSSSMEDTLLIGDYLLVNKFIYGSRLPFGEDRFLEIRDPERDDVIVFKFPSYTSLDKFSQRNTGVPESVKKAWLGTVRSNHRGNVDFIKRIIGVPGDIVEVRDKQVYINDKAYSTQQKVHKDNLVIPGPLPNDIRGSYRDNFGPITVPADSYFVMGDNRDYSLDSRFWGFVPRQNIHGLAFIKYWSWDSQAFRPRIGRVGRPIH